MRGTRAVACVAIVAATLTGCSRDDDAPPPAAAMPDPSTWPVVTEGCLDPEEQRLQEGGHLLGAASPPVPYSSVPPTSGWHASGAGVAPGAYGTPVSETEQVLWLERGGVVVAYDPAALPEEQVAELNLLASEVPTAVVTPYETPMPSAIAVTAWGWLQRCGTVDVETIDAFAEAYSGVDRSD